MQQWDVPTLGCGKRLEGNTICQLFLFITQCEWSSIMFLLNYFDTCKMLTSADSSDSPLHWAVNVFQHTEEVYYVLCYETVSWMVQRNYNMRRCSLFCRKCLVEKGFCLTGEMSQYLSTSVNINYAWCQCLCIVRKRHTSDIWQST
jgi:hypothetical protein